ncbi:hypothetical protein [Arthrobacter caoxuetaonis]|uniref:hypothetical protein n=1 Tax=Arthrobacter caoxuetaonis TaxID=2886935 RepID=UPI001D13FD1B|nr:hypothetical protein [Arthrobacter caoxuetaonis]MCC3284117.1 hypothetical protein [Arthrobacter caoxuetaonis]
MFTAECSANVALERPSDWEVIPHPDAELVVAAPLTKWMEEGGFRPNVAVTAFPFPGTVTQLSTVVMASLLTSLADPYLISVDPVPQLEAVRRLEYLHRGSGGLIHCSQLLLIRNGLAASVTTSCSANQLTAYDEVLGAIALSATLKDPSNG